jgi:hypothetical protein
MITPASRHSRQRIEDLARFESLFAKALVVEHASRCMEVGVWKKCLDWVSPCFSPLTQSSFSQFLFRRL